MLSITVEIYSLLVYSHIAHISIPEVYLLGILHEKKKEKALLMGAWVAQVS